MRTILHKTIENPKLLKQQLLLWSNQFREAVFLDTNDYLQNYSNYDCLVAVDALTSIKTDYTNAFIDLHQYQSQTNDWLFGYLSYDLKNDIEDLKSNNCDGLQFPDLYFFQPKKIFLLKGNQLEIHYLFMCDDEIDSDFNEILSLTSSFQLPTSCIIKQRISKENYLSKAEKMLAHIHRGDIYEANFCMEFYAENAIIDTLEIYKKLNTISEPPFAVYFKNNSDYLLCASPPPPRPQNVI